MDNNTLFFATVKKCEEMAKETGLTLPTGIVYKMNGRFTRTLGRCSKKTTRGYVTHTIEVSEKYFTECVNTGNIFMIEDTLLHEMCHALPKCMNHGEEWQRAANRINVKFGYDIKRCCESNDITTRVLFANCDTTTIHCAGCGKDYTKKSNSVIVKNVTKYRCICGSDKLVIMENNH